METKIYITITGNPSPEQIEWVHEYTLQMAIKAELPVSVQSKDGGDMETKVYITVSGNPSAEHTRIICDYAELIKGKTGLEVVVLTKGGWFEFAPGMPPRLEVSVVSEGGGFFEAISPRELTPDEFEDIIHWETV